MLLMPLLPSVRGTIVELVFGTWLAGENGGKLSLSVQLRQ